MSLDVYLTSDKKTKRPASSGIFIREGGKTIEISREEWDRRNPGREPVVFKHLDDESNVLYQQNITHNLGQMATAAGLYKALWRPDEQGWTTAEQLIEPLIAGYRELCSDPDKYKQFNPDNGWGSYEDLVEFTAFYLLACIRNPKAKVEVSR